MIELMKFDMGGSASTLGAAAAIAQLKPKDIATNGTRASLLVTRTLLGAPGLTTSSKDDATSNKGLRYERNKDSTRQSRVDVPVTRPICRQAKIAFL